MPNEEGVDLIVIGTHGRTGLKRVLMGSVAESVMRLATCPVLTVKQANKVPAARIFAGPELRFRALAARRELAMKRWVTMGGWDCC